MKKKTRFRLKNDLAVPFRISISICLICAAISSLLFYKSFFRALEKINEEPIATITFKYKTAQRKFLERVVWDRLRQNSYVYNGDTIHTAELSEATVWFDDGTTLELLENTMAQVFRHEDGTLDTQLEKGGATVDSSNGGNGMTLSAGGIKLNVKGGSKVSAQKEERGTSVNLTVQKGNASLEDGTSLGQGGTFAVNENGAKQASVSVSSPLPNEKLLYYTEGACPVKFSWAQARGKTAVPLVLTIAHDKDFINVEKTYKAEAKASENVNISLNKGIWYWRLTEDTGDGAGFGAAGAGGAINLTGKIQVIQALKPILLAPAEDYSYQFRKIMPAVRFIWTESDTATAYNFAVSKNADMSRPVLEQRSSSASIIISTLGAGRYYWQVTPFYTVNRIGLANPSEKGSFVIDQRGELTAPVLFMPAEGEFVNKTKSIVLSWNVENEASSYKVQVARTENLGGTVIQRETSENFLSISGDELAEMSEGQYYWAVTQVDSEGNLSPRSKVRSFYVVNGKVEQRTVFPPDEYKIWKPLVADTRFTWKSNILFNQKIQVARDRTFRNLIVDEETANMAFSGIELEPGEYYWRITAGNGAFEKSTKEKKLVIVSEYAPPRQLEPTSQKKAVVRPKQKCMFRWEEAEDADYYRLRLYKLTDGEAGEPLLDENFIVGNEYELDMEPYKEGRYRWDLQYYSYENETSSRRSSKLSAEDFMLRKIRPVVLKAPAHNSVKDGWDAIKKAQYLTWDSDERLGSVKLTLRKVKGTPAFRRTYTQPAKTFRMEPLSAGTYEWTVQATTSDGLDVSAVRPARFTVKEIPPFMAPQIADPKEGSVFNAEVFKANGLFIKLEWKASGIKYKEEVNGYAVEIYNKKKKPVWQATIAGADKTSVTLEKEALAKLGKGEYTWKVKAVRLNEKTKDILVDGVYASGSFIIDINVGGTARQKDGDFYAQ